MSLDKRVSELESRLSPHPQVIALVYRPEPLDEGEDAPTTLSDAEAALYHQLLAEALESNPYAQGFTLYLSENPRWEVWGSEQL
ncbi:hypothetical protein [Calidithermus chliarophilus]|uniref:hypothetical protein n=1 Tax=Calidithermus chliarophilus TaxID=52023 RepID=UPI00041B6773|nr:hypothetical protein [Calidithermus chliarophilus]